MVLINYNKKILYISILIIGLLSTSLAYAEYIYVELFDINALLTTVLKSYIKKDYTLEMVDATLASLIENILNLNKYPHWLTDEHIIYIANLDQQKFVNEFILNWNLPITHDLYDTLMALKKEAYERNRTWSSWLNALICHLIGSK